MSNFSMLEGLVSKSRSQMLSWIEAEYNTSIKPIYTSVDLRNAGFKIAHVDANVFPSGFNNISADSQKLASSLLKLHMKNYDLKTKKILLVSENFTRNINYLKNLKMLEQLFFNAGFDIKIGSPYIDQQLAVPELNLGIYPIERIKNTVHIKEFIPEIVILNNDLTLGLHAILKDIEQHIVPNPKLGWHNRRKTRHFSIYSTLAQRFAEEFGFDSWLINTLVESCENIDFRKKQGLECIAEKVDKMLNEIKQKYKENNILESPFVFIKSDMGTYGMGIWPVKSGDEVLHINKKHRHSMDVIKHGVHNSDVIIQEGVPTIETENGHTSETMAYLINGTVFDLLNRVNQDKDKSSNLNSHGMYFSSHITDAFSIKTCIASLATLAITKEA